MQGSDDDAASAKSLFLRRVEESRLGFRVQNLESFGFFHGSVRVARSALISVITRVLYV